MNLYQTVYCHMSEDSDRQSASQISLNNELCQAFSFVSFQSYFTYDV
jgi:hypothetical protein